MKKENNDCMSNKHHHDHHEGAGCQHQDHQQASCEDETCCSDDDCCCGDEDCCDDDCCCDEDCCCDDRYICGDIYCCGDLYLCGDDCCDDNCCCDDDCCCDDTCCCDDDCACGCQGSQTTVAIGSPAPAFEAMTSNGPISFPEDYEGSWVILFSHPGDFTPVCTTEFLTFGAMQEEFEKLNTKLIGLSVDSTPSHIAWLRDIENLHWKDFKNVKIDYPVIDDVSMKVAKRYGMIHDPSSKKTLRALFIIDPKGVLRLIIYYPASTGRNMQEIKRALIALQTADKQGVATPADWQPGEPVIDPMPPTKEEVAARAEKGEGLDLVTWYLAFKPSQD